MSATTTRKKPIRDAEIGIVTRLCELLATLEPAARRRVLAYVCARVETLPTIAAVGGGTEDDHKRVDPSLFGAEAVS